MLPEKITSKHRKITTTPVHQAAARARAAGAGRRAGARLDAADHVLGARAAAEDLGPGRVAPVRQRDQQRRRLRRAQQQLRVRQLVRHAQHREHQALGGRAPHALLRLGRRAYAAREAPAVLRAFMTYTVPKRAPLRLVLRAYLHGAAARHAP